MSHWQVNLVYLQTWQNCYPIDSRSLCQADISLCTFETLQPLSAVLSAVIYLAPQPQTLKFSPKITFRLLLFPCVPHLSLHWTCTQLYTSHARGPLSTSTRIKVKLSSSFPQYCSCFTLLSLGIEKKRVFEIWTCRLQSNGFTRRLMEYQPTRHLHSLKQSV